MAPRRTVLLAMVALFVLLASQADVEAQRTTKVPTVGVLLPQAPGPLLNFFRDGLRERGHVDGQTVVIEARGVNADPARIPDAVAELLQLHPDVLVVMNNIMAFTAKKATSSTPIVIVSAHDAVGTGLVASLARPGGNVTGGESMAPELDGKRIEIIREVVPTMSRLAVVYNPADPGMAFHLRHTDAAAARLGFTVRRMEVRTLAQLDAALSALAQDRPDALLPFGDTLVGGHMNLKTARALGLTIPPSLLLRADEVIE